MLQARLSGAEERPKRGAGRGGRGVRRDSPAERLSRAYVSQLNRATRAPETDPKTRVGLLAGAFVLFAVWETVLDGASF